MWKIITYNVLTLLALSGLLLGSTEITLRTQKAFTQKSVSAVGIPISQPDDLNTYGHVPHSQAANGYGNPTPKIKINNLGFRNDQNFMPNTDKKNILVLGDSFTFGTGVGQNQTFSGLLKDENTQVWNAGIIGYSINNYRAQFESLQSLIKPDLVIFNIFVANDITELRRKKDIIEDGELRRVEDQKVFANSEQKLESHESRVPKSFALHWLNQRWDILSYKNGWKDPRSESPTLTWPVFLDEAHPAWDPHLPDYWQRFEEHLLAIKAFAEKNNTEILISLVPMDVQVSKHYESKYARLYFDDEARASDRPQTKIIQQCQIHNLTCVNVLPELRAHRKKDQLYFSHNADPHFDLLGHQVYADFLKKHIQ